MTVEVPEELVRVLLNDQLTEVEALHVGALPPSFPEDLVPEESTRVLGGTTSRQNVTAAFELKTDADLFTVSSGYQRLGYQNEQFGSDEGFQQNTFRMMRKDRSRVTILTVPATPGQPVIVKISVSEIVGVIPAARHHRIFDSFFPALTPPPGSMSRGGGSGGSDNNRDTREELQTDLSPAEVLAHYEPQLRAAGWSTLEVHTDQHGAMQWLAVTDKEGADWRGLISAIGHAGGVSVSLSMSTAKDPERTMRLARRMEILFAEHPARGATSRQVRLTPQQTRRPPDP